MSSGRDPCALAVAGATWAEMVARHDRSDRAAVVSATGVWSYRELVDRARSWAGWFDALGLAPGTVVPILIGSTPTAYALLLAGALTGRPLAPLGNRLTVTEIAACVRPFGSPLLVADSEFAALSTSVAEAAGCRAVELPDLDGAGPPPDGTLSFQVPRDAVAVVLHTSGTTGLPKPVAFRMDRLGARCRVYSGLLNLQADDIYSSSQQFHHLGGVGLLMVAMSAGTAVVPSAGRFSAEDWRALGDLGATHATLAPTMIERLLADGSLEFPSLRMITYGAAPIRPATAARLASGYPRIGLLQGYSQTEGGPITALTPEDHVRGATEDPALLASVGRPVPGTEVIIHDPDAAGIGEVWAQADHLAAPQPDGWLRTGDLGRFGAHRYLYLAGRKGDMIIRGGENVYPEEVENRITCHPGVREAAVVGVPHDDLGEQVVAYVVPREPSAPPQPDDLRRFVRAELAGFKVPARWIMVDELPRGPLGKVLRRRLCPGAQA